MYELNNLKITKYPQSGFRINWSGDSSFSLNEMSNGKYEQVIYIDPFKLPQNEPKADIIFISHEHMDHCHPESIEKILSDNTVVIGNALVKEALKDLNIKNFNETHVKTRMGINGLVYNALPAYNVDKFRSPGQPFHPMQNGGIGFLLNFNIHDAANNVAVYHMGDTDYVEEEMTPSKVNVLMIPVSGTYVMTAEEASKAANKIMPDTVAIPMHYDAGIVGSIEDAQEFKEMFQGVTKIIEAVS